MNLLSLPDDLLRDVLSDSSPRQEHLRWEWADVTGLTCTAFRRLSKDLTPHSLELHKFKTYFRRGSSSNVCCKILRSLRDTGWKAARLTELHVNWSSVLKQDARNNVHFVADTEVLEALRSLLSTPGALPSLTWLDIYISSDHIWEFALVDSKLLSEMPTALPKVTKLCLAGCFKHGPEEVSPSELKCFAESLRAPLESLSLKGVHWMSDEHIAALLPVIGGNLTRFELFGCIVYELEETDEGDVETYIPLSDVSMAVIARECRRVQSFSITDTDITSSGVAAVLQANEGLRKLDLSSNNALGRETAGVIAMYAPRLESFRNYWNCTPKWLDDAGIIAMIDGQMKYSQGSGVFLKTLGVRMENAVTNRGIRYALERGVRTIEIDEDYNFSGQTCSVLARDFPNVQIVRPAYPNYVDGSLDQA